MHQASLNCGKQQNAKAVLSKTGDIGGFHNGCNKQFLYSRVLEI